MNSSTFKGKELSDGGELKNPFVNMDKNLVFVCHDFKDQTFHLAVATDTWERGWDATVPYSTITPEALDTQLGKHGKVRMDDCELIISAVTEPVAVVKKEDQDKEESDSSSSDSSSASIASGGDTPAAETPGSKRRANDCPPDDAVPPAKRQVAEPIKILLCHMSEPDVLRMGIQFCKRRSDDVCEVMALQQLQHNLSGGAIRLGFQGGRQMPPQCVIA